MNIPDVMIVKDNRVSLVSVKIVLIAKDCLYLIEGDRACEPGYK